jgi:hypothetical protein
MVVPHTARAHTHRRAALAAPSSRARQAAAQAHCDCVLPQPHGHHSTHSHIFAVVCARVCDFTTPFLLPFPSLQDTVTGFLLAGVGQKDAKGLNFLVVDASA